MPTIPTLPSGFIVCGTAAEMFCIRRSPPSIIQWEAVASGRHVMRKAMEFPTEWTMPDPAEDCDNTEPVSALEDPQGAAMKDANPSGTMTTLTATNRAES